MQRQGVKKELTSGMVLDNHTFHCLEQCCCFGFFFFGGGVQKNQRLSELVFLLIVLPIHVKIRQGLYWISNRKRGRSIALGWDEVGKVNAWE